MSIVRMIKLRLILVEIWVLIISLVQDRMEADVEEQKEIAVNHVNHINQVNRVDENTIGGETKALEEFCRKKNLIFKNGDFNGIISSYAKI